MVVVAAINVVTHIVMVLWPMLFVVVGVKAGIVCWWCSRCCLSLVLWSMLFVVVGVMVDVVCCWWCYGRCCCFWCLCNGRCYLLVMVLWSILFVVITTDNVCWC